MRPRFSAYVEASKAVFEVFDDTSPSVEGISIDEAFLDVGGLAKISGSPPEIAARLRREVLRKVGLPITVGVARTKFLAKVASGVAKPDGLVVVDPETELAFLHDLPVEMMWERPMPLSTARSRNGPNAVAPLWHTRPMSPVRPPSVREDAVAQMSNAGAKSVELIDFDAGE